MLPLVTGFEADPEFERDPAFEVDPEFERDLEFEREEADEDSAFFVPTLTTWVTGALTTLVET